MGYRSDVAYGIAFGVENYIIRNPPVAPHIDLDRPKNLFYTFLAEAKSRPETQKCFVEHSGVDVEEDKLRILFKAESTKWYEDSGYDDVDCHMALLDLADEYIEQLDGQGMDNTTYMSLNYVRIGEDLNDNEQRMGGNSLSHEYFYINRSIDWHV